MFACLPGVLVDGSPPVANLGADVLGDSLMIVSLGLFRLELRGSGVYVRVPFVCECFVGWGSHRCLTAFDWWHTVRRVEDTHRTTATPLDDDAPAMSSPQADTPR